MRALVVDHHVEVATWITAELEAHGYAVTVATDAAQALQRLGELDPHIVLVEIALPDMNGWRLARHIRRLRGEEAPRLIAISAFDHPALFEQSRRAGFQQHLVKPLRSETLAAAVFHARQDF